MTTTHPDDTPQELARLSCPRCQGAEYRVSRDWDELCEDCQAYEHEAAMCDAACDGASAREVGL